MIFLPIVERELRTAARRRMTYWMRSSIALVAMVTGGWIFLANIDEAQETVGPYIFIGLSVLAILCCLVVGRYTTVDCLSEEKREGTLGLLFLTDLKGYDVVLGKLVATSMNGFFGLLAMFPVLAITLMMGGVSSGQLWRIVLVLANTFLFSLALGIFASSLCRDLRRSVGIFFLLLMFCSVVMPGIAFVVAASTPSHLFIPALCLPSPGFTCVMAFDFCYARMPALFWISLGLIHFMTWLFVLMACYAAPRSWQDRPVTGARRSWRELWQQWSYGNAEKRAAFRRRLLGINPFYWLAGRDRLKPYQVWLWLSLITIGWCCGWFSFGEYWLSSMVAVAAGFIANLTLKLWVLIESGQRLAEERQMGSLELLLTTPLTVRDILRGQRLALQRQFLLPVAGAIAAQLFLLYYLRGPYRWELDEALTASAGLILLVTDLAAIYWVSMLTALTARNPNQASLGVVSRVMILPWILFGLVAVPASILVEDLEWKFYLGIWLGLGLAADLGFGLLAWHRLRSGFRALATGRAGRGASIVPQ